MKRARRNFLAVLGGVATMLPMTKFPTPGNVYEHLKGCWSFYEAEELLNGNPLRRENILFFKGDAYSVLSEYGQDVIRLNKTAARIWELCDGKNNPEGIAEIISEEYEVSTRACLSDVVITLRHFKRHGLIVC